MTALEIIVSHSYLGLVMEYASGGAMVTNPLSLSLSPSSYIISHYHSLLPDPLARSPRPIPSPDPHSQVRYIADNMKPGGGLAIDENEARYYFIQLLSAIEHCHKHKVTPSSPP